MIPLYLFGAPLSATILVTRTPQAGDCPDAERIAAQVESIVGRPLSAPDGTPGALVFRVEFSRWGGTYEATVRLTGTREGERVLRDQSPACEALGDAVAVTTALLLDPSERAPPPVPPAQRTVPERTLSWLELWFSGRLGAGAGLVEAPTWIAGGGLEASLGPLTSIELGGALTGEHPSTLGAGAVRVGLWYAELGGFRSLTGARFRLGPLVQLMGGALRGAGEGYPSSSSASLAWFAAAAGIRADIRLGSPLRLGVRALAVVPARKHAFSIGYVGTAYESSSVAGMAELVLGVKFW